MQSRTDIEQYPPQIVQPQRGEHVGTPCNRFLDLLAVRADGLFAPLFDLRDDRKAIAGRSSWIDRTVPASLELEVPLLRNGHRRGLAPVVISRRHLRSPSTCSGVREHYSPGIAQIPLSPTTNWLANDHFVAVHLPVPVGQWSPALSSSNGPARTNNKPLTTSTHAGNVIVTHMLRSLARSTATAAK